MGIEMEALEPVQEAIAAGHIELARNLLRVLIEKYPDNADVWYWAAQAAVNDAQRNAFLEKAVTLDPLHHQAANELYMMHNTSTGLKGIPQPLLLDESSQAPQTRIRYASFSKRAVATLIDTVVTLIVFYPIILVGISIITAITNGQAGINMVANDPQILGLAYCLLIIGQCIYYGYFLSQQKGQTLGKGLLRIRVIKLDGSKISIWEAILRNVIGYQLSNAVPGIGFLWMLSDKQSRAWHDMISNTIVVEID